MICNNFANNIQCSFLNSISLAGFEVNTNILNHINVVFISFHHADLDIQQFRNNSLDLGFEYGPITDIGATG